MSGIDLQDHVTPTYQVHKDCAEYFSGSVPIWCYDSAAQYATAGTDEVYQECMECMVLCDVQYLQSVPGVYAGVAKPYDEALQAVAEACIPGIGLRTPYATPGMVLSYLPKKTLCNARS
eukprot:790515-Rhodomonas_salina.4